MSVITRRHLLALAGASLVVSCAHAQSVAGSGRLATEPRAVAGFEAIQLEASFKVIVRQGAAEAVQLRADDNLLPLIETVVESRGGRPTLVLRWKRGTSVRHGGDVVVTVDAVRLRALSASGSGTIESDAIRTDRMALSVAGSGDLRVRELDADEVDASIAGSGDVRAGGRAARVKVSIAGSGDADFSGLTADDVKVSIAGSGDANVTANQALAVSIAGSGDVRYAGAVSAVKTSIVGSGNVRRR